MKSKLMALLEQLSFRPTSIKRIVYLIILLAVVWLGYSTVVSKRYHQTAQSIKDEVQYKRLLVRSIARSKSLPVLRKQVKTLKELIKDAPEAFFNRDDLPKLIDELSGLAAQSGLRLRVLSPKPVNRKKSNVSFKINFTCDGEFQQLSDFVNRLNSLRQIISIVSYQITPYSQIDGRVILKANMTLQTYSLLVDKKVL